MTRNTTIDDCIDRAVESIGAAWPLHSFVTANPLAGFEDEPFHEAVADAERLFGGRGYPHPDVFRTALNEDQIDRGVLLEELREHGIDADPETLLDEMAADEAARDVAADATDDATAAVDRVLSKWLAAFLDQGESAWPMPDRDQGFYAAWRELAPHDGDVPDCDAATDLPETADDALDAVLSRYPADYWEAILEHHLAALPGWTGFIKQRAQSDADPWQASYPISLADYLAVRLTLADLFDAPIQPDVDDAPEPANDDVPVAEHWLTAWEKTYRRRLLDGLDDSVTDSADAAAGRPDAQFVFCIDTRSEVIRRHVEAAGDYETHGYAGFFGVPMRYRGYGADVSYDACPPIVDPQHHVSATANPDRQKEASTHAQWRTLVETGHKHLKALKTNLAAAFTFVEGAGSAYGAAMASRTLLPSFVYDLQDAVDEWTPDVETVASPVLEDGRREEDGLPVGMTFVERVAYAESAFNLMGWDEFARLVVFAGHASQTTNNPFDSSLDCGACAGNPGGPNARVLAAICNDEDVRSALQDRGYDVPDDTVFVAAEHDTTTDEVQLFDDPVPESHDEDLAALRADLADARRNAAAERTGTDDAGTGVREAERKAADWAETRPEWGLAGNASFVVGPRALTADANLDGRAFLHSYDWTTDQTGNALEAIMTGPMVVTQWINNQYYFATVDTAVYGSGSKVTQNPVGNVGVFQGNGGDLMTGLPIQSLYDAHDDPHHQPVRLTTVVHAPIDRVTGILEENDHVRTLLDNGWIRLTVMDPEQDNAFLHYVGGLEWERAAAETQPTPSTDSIAVPVATGDD